MLYTSGKSGVQHHNARLLGSQSIKYLKKLV